MKSRLTPFAKLSIVAVLVFIIGFIVSKTSSSQNEPKTSAITDTVVITKTVVTYVSDDSNSGAAAPDSVVKSSSDNSNDKTTTAKLEGPWGNGFFQGVLDGVAFIFRFIANLTKWVNLQEQIGVVYINGEGFLYWFGFVVYGLSIGLAIIKAIRKVFFG